jgi:hypothetical protein
MAGRSRSLGRMPLDAEARARLREAQAAEASATSAVYSASATLDVAVAKRDKLLSTASVAVTDAEAALGESYSHLVSVSGLDRAALLLGLPRATLRKAAAPRRPEAPPPGDVSTVP